MSAFVVSHAHINAIIATGRDLKVIDPGNMTNAGRTLLLENVASVTHRYPDKAGEYNVGAYVYREGASPLTIVAALKLIQCYAYQSCEHEGWATSGAKVLCEHITDALIQRMDGYETAPWAI